MRLMDFWWVLVSRFVCLCIFVVMFVLIKFFVWLFRVFDGCMVLVEVLLWLLFVKWFYVLGSYVC